MLPGKKHKPEDYLEIAKRRIWFILVPFAIVSAGTAVVARKLPDVYRSSALILVIPQQVPESLVRSTVTTRLEDRLLTIQQTIMSRTKLEHIIEDLNLYPEERRTGIMQDAVEHMRDHDVHVDIQKGDSLSVTYQGANPRTVQKVAEQLAGLFITESTQDRASATENASQFLEGQLEDARRSLRDQEAKLQQYREKFSGQLPSQLEGNLQALANTQMQIQAVYESINRSASQKLILDRQIAEWETDQMQQAGATPLSAGVDPMTGGTTAQQLSAWQERLKGFEAQGLTDKHSDVKTAKAHIADLQKQYDAEQLSRPVSGDSAVSPADRQRTRKIEDLKSQRDEFDKQIAKAQEEEKRLRAIRENYQHKIDQVPARESEMVDLTRDYGILQSTYASLLQKKQDSALAANLERRQIGEQFKLIDAARIPEKPVSPNRPLLNLLGMAVGLAVGVGLVVLLEYRDTSFKTDDEITQLLSLPVLAVVPLMQSTEEQKKSTRRRLVIGFALGSGVMACMAILAYTFIKAR